MNWPRLRIRCDAGADHGLGHLMRCLSLAKALRAAGGPVAEFWMQAPDRIFKRVQDAGFSAISSSSQAGVAGADCDNMLAWCRQVAFEDEQKPWLIVDGKYADPVALAPVAEKSHLVCFDDEPYRDFPADVIVNAQPWTAETDYPARAGRHVLAGGRYNAIDPGYFAARNVPNRKAVLITLGGEDPANDTAWTVMAMADLLAPFPVIVVIGPAHPDPKGAVGAVTRYLPQAEIHHAPASLVPMAERSFFAISAGGTSCYELQAASIAVAAIAVEDHQIPFVAALERLGGVVPLVGPAVGNKARPTDKARAIVKRLLADDGWRNARVTRGNTLFPEPGGPLLARTLMKVLQT
ncbi:hypothetical protein LPB41_21505 [Thalassospira sp. MA62]|nr:hypothetical protein [Thalassospira sp. MA62]